MRLVIKFKSCANHKEGAPKTFWDTLQRFSRVAVLLLGEGGFAAEGDHVLAGGVHLKGALEGFGREVDVEVNHVFHNASHLVAGELDAASGCVLADIIVVDDHIEGEVL